MVAEESQDNDWRNASLIHFIFRTRATASREADDRRRFPKKFWAATSGRGYKFMLSEEAAYTGVCDKIVFAILNKVFHRSWKTGRLYR